jgi:hypothetical protein
VSAFDKRRLERGAIQFREVLHKAWHVIMSILACNSFSLNRLQRWHGPRLKTGATLGIIK